MIQINGVACNKEAAGTGLPDCYLKLGIYKSAYLVTDPNWSLNLATDTYTKDYVISKIMDGTFVPLLQSDSFARNTPDTTRQDYDGGIVRSVRNGKPMGTFTFNNGPMWHAEVSKYDGRQGLQMIFIDTAGTQRLEKSVDGLSISGIELSDFNVETYVEQIGDTNAATNITYQVADEIAYNQRPALIDAATAGFNGNKDVRGIIDVTITGSGDVSDGIVTVDVLSKINTQFGAKGLTATDFQLINDVTGAEITITSVTPVVGVAGRYQIAATLTGVTAVRVNTYNEDLEVNVARVGTSSQLFRGLSNAISVAASISVFAAVFANTFA